MRSMERLFPSDRMSKRDRVEATLLHQPVDRAALHEQLSYNPSVIALYTGKPVRGFDYTVDDVCEVIRKTMDMCFPPVAPRGTESFTTPDGFVYQNDNWTFWRVSRPFTTVDGARIWLQKRKDDMRDMPFDAESAREAYRAEMLALQRKIGEAVVLNYSSTGFCDVWDHMGLELFTFFSLDCPDALADFMETSTACEERRIHAVADAALSPAILIPEDFATKQGSIFSPRFLDAFHLPYVRRLAAAWHEHGIHVLYHSDGNYKRVIPDLIGCGVDGFYCLEPGVRHGHRRAQARLAEHGVGRRRGWRGLDGARHARAGARRGAAAHPGNECAVDRRIVRRLFERDQPADSAAELPRHGRSGRRTAQPGAVVTGLRRNVQSSAAGLCRGGSFLT